MFTIFHVFIVLGAFFGVLVGAASGFLRSDWLGLLPGALLGLIFGILCGKIPFWLAQLFVIRRIAPLSTDEIWTALREPDCVLTNFMLLELRKRGEDDSQIMRLALEMLTSDERGRRQNGLAAFWSAFPDFEERISGYSPDASDTARRDSLKALEDDLIAGRLFPSP